MAISKTVELKVKTVDETTQNAKRIESGLKSIERAANDAGQAGKRFGTDSHQNTAKLSQTYEKLNTFVERYSKVMTNATGKVSENIKSIAEDSSKLKFDTSVSGLAKSGIAAAAAWKSVEFASRQITTTFFEMRGETDKAAKNIASIYNSYRKIPIVGKSITDFVTNLPWADGIKDIAVIANSEEKINKLYQERLDIAKEIRNTMKATADANRQAHITGLGFSGGNTSFINSVFQLRSGISGERDKQTEINRDRNNVLTERQKLFDDYFQDWSIGSASRQTRLARELYQRQFAKIDPATDKLPEVLRGLTPADVHANRLSPEQQRAVMLEWGGDVGTFDTLSGKAADLQKLSGSKDTQIEATERQIKAIRDSFGKETAELVSNQQESLDLTNKQYQREAEILSLRKAGKDYEADRLQIEYQLANDLEANKKHQQDIIDQLKERNEALKEAGLATVDIKDESTKLAAMYAQQETRLKRIAQLKQQTLEQTERERREQERLEQVRSANRSAAGATISVAERLLQDRAAAGDKSAESKLSQISFEKNRRQMMNQVKEAIAGQIGLGTFSGLQKAGSLAGLLGDITAMKFTEKKQFTDVILPDLRDRGNTTGVRENYLDSINSMRKSEEAKELEKLNKETKKTNELLGQMAINAIVLEEK